MIVERFAPSPTGPLHVGHAYSALRAFEAAEAVGGRFLLRIEDLDPQRSRDAFVQAIFDDLAWLGLRWETPVLRQSSRFGAYRDALKRLSSQGLLYPCRRTRRERNAAQPDPLLTAPQEGVSAPQEGVSAPQEGVSTPKEGVSAPREGGAPAPGEGAAPPVLRLDMRRAVRALGGLKGAQSLWFEEIGAGPNGESGRVALTAEGLIERHGDVALGRRDAAAAYHLAVVVDDAWQGVTHVTRGCDLFAVTEIHRLLQALLGLPTPIYRHHPLMRDARGKRLAKRDDARALATYRAQGWTPADMRALFTQAS